MKIFAAISLLIAVTAAAAQTPAQPKSGPESGKAAPVCLELSDSTPSSIDHTKVADPSTILFYMRDGKIWKNTLSAPCPGLVQHGFTFLSREDKICSNAQGIQVLETGDICLLGDFTPYAPPVAPSPAPTPN